MGGKEYTIGSLSNVWGAGTPLFARVVCRGTNDTRRHKVPQPYNADILRVTRTPYYVYDKGFLVQGPAWVNWGYGHMVPAADSNLINQVLSKIADDVRGGHSWNAAVMAAESKQAIEQVRNTASAVANLGLGLATLNPTLIFRSLGRGLGHVDKTKIRKKLATNDISGAWLALQYGIKPTLQDCYEAAKAFESISKYRSLRYSASVRSSITFDDRASPAYNPLPGSSYRNVKYIVTLHENISFARSIGLLDPLSVIWEKVPWSFVIDWALPIGLYLSNVSVLAGLQCTWVKSDFARTQAHGEKAFPDNPRIQWYAPGGAWHYDRVVFRRTVGTGGLSVPTPNIKDVDRIFSLTHIKNASALLHQQFSRARGASALRGVTTG